MIPFKRGDRVRDRITGDEGRVHAIYPDDAEDNLEVKLDGGSYTCRDWRRFDLLAPALAALNTDGEES